jgi:hypothetical protein
VTNTLARTPTHRLLLLLNGDCHHLNRFWLLLDTLIHRDTLLLLYRLLLLLLLRLVVHRGRCCRCGTSRRPSPIGDGTRRPKSPGHRSRNSSKQRLTGRKVSRRKGPSNLLRRFNNSICQRTSRVFPNFSHRGREKKGKISKHAQNRLGWLAK